VVFSDEPVKRASLKLTDQLYKKSYYGCALLPPARCLLPPASCLLPPASCLLPPASCLLPPASCLLLA